MQLEQWLLSRSDAIRRTDSSTNAAAVVLFYCLLTFVLLAPFIQLSGYVPSSSVIRQSTYFCIFALTLVAIDIKSTPSRLVALPFGLTLAFIWCGLSMFWAIDADFGVRRLLLTLMITWTTFALSRHIGYEECLRVARRVLPVMLAASYLAVLLFPSIGVQSVYAEDDPMGLPSWCGVFADKNAAGPVCAITVLLFALDSKVVSAFTRALVVLAASYFLYRTNSKTAIGVLLTSLLVAFGVQIYRPKYRIILAHILIIFASATVVYSYYHWDQLIAPLYDPGAFTGRTQIWPFLVLFAKDRLLTGAGFGSFWIRDNSAPIFAYTDGWISRIASGHNGYLDLLAQVGIPGLCLIVLAAIVVPLFRLLAHDFSSRTRASLLFSIVWFALWQNMTESSLFVVDTTVNVFLMLSISLLGCEKLERN